jgi:Flp pilus assembly protein TadB
MDVVWLALGVVLLLVVGLVCTGWWLVADTRRHRRRTRSAETRLTRKLNRPAHLFCGQRHAVTVAELVERAARQSEGIRLTWPEADIDDAELVRPYAQDLFPTAIVPRHPGAEER